MSRLRSFVGERLTPTGRLVFGLTVLANLVVGSRITWGLAGLLLTSAAAARWARVAVRVDWEVPGRVTRGVAFQIRFALENHSRRGVRDLTLAPQLTPHAGISEPTYVPWLAPGQRASGEIALTFPRRGHFIISGLRQATLFPFGLWRDWVDHGGGKAVLVYPSFTPLLRLDIPVGRRYQPGGIALSSNLGDSTEFLCTREFRQGDSLRQIHWSSWARTGKPIVKEFQEEFFCRIALVMDTFIDPISVTARRGEFEAAVTLAAALADNLSREEYVIDLFAAGPQLYQLQAGRSLAHFENVMDILACVEPCGEPAFEKLEPILLDCLENVTTAVILLPAWDERRERLVQAVGSRGCAVKVILVGGQGKAPLLEGGGEMIRLTGEEIEAGVERL